MNKKSLFVILFFVITATIFTQQNAKQECFLLMAGRNATADGSVMIAHNNDLTGWESSLVEIVKSPVMSDSIRLASGLKIPVFENNFKMLVLKISKGYEEGDAAAINEKGVAIGGGVALGDDRDTLTAKLDTLVTKGLTGGIRYLALRNVRSAHECVSQIGELYTKYGVTYPSGISIADSKEIWYLEAGGGHMWAAVRVPDSCCMVVANGYRINEIDFDDRDNFMVPPGLLEFCKKNGLADSNARKINFADIFGRGRENRYYDTRRVWRGISLINDSLNISADDTKFPMFVKPKQKLSLSKLFLILRDQYEGTQYSLDKTKDERLIGSSKTVHSEVIQLSRSRERRLDAILWTGMGNPKYTVYLPFYSGVKDIPSEYAIGGEVFDARSAFWNFKDLAEKMAKINLSNRKAIAEKLRIFENRIIRSQNKTRSKYFQFLGRNKETADNYLAEYLKSLAGSTMRIIKIIASDLDKVIK